MLARKRLKRGGWHDRDSRPFNTGWYQVRRWPGGSLAIRAYGNGHWWAPLPDGWLSADGCYEWKLPRVSKFLEIDDMSPLDELKAVQLNVTMAKRAALRASEGL